MYVVRETVEVDVMVTTSSVDEELGAMDAGLLLSKMREIEELFGRMPILVDWAVVGCRLSIAASAILARIDFMFELLFENRRRD